MRISAIFKKWDLLVTLEGKYIYNGFIYTNISRVPRVKCTHVASKLCTQQVFILLTSNLYVINLSCARSEDFCTRVVRALLHTRVFVKFKSSCTVAPNNILNVRHLYNEL